MSGLLQVEGLSRYFQVGGARTSVVPGRLAAWLGTRPAAASGNVLQAIDDVSFTIAPGESVGLVGESGSGKSTAARLVCRLLDPTAGRILLAGRDIGSVPARRFAGDPDRSSIQMVFQDATDSLNPRFTAFDAIADPLRRLGPRSDRAEMRRWVDELADLVGLPGELLGRFPHQLSGGQKARVGIARAIALSPKLLVLDEPTSSLDVSVQAVILHLLDDLRRRLGMSYLFVSHDLNVVRLLCTRVLVMYLGKIVEAGPVDALFDHPRHPYTRALLSAIPAAFGNSRRRRIRLSGEPRSPIDPSPTVCRFYGRCPDGFGRCATEMPALRHMNGDHAVACHLFETDAPTDSFASEGSP